MPLNTDGITFAVGSQEVLEQMPSLPALPIFSDAAIGLLDEISKRLLKSGETRTHSDVRTFAFWCRRANTTKMKRNYEGKGLRIGRGIVFHIAPSNVAVNFAYSFASALLAGNASIVRLPSKAFAQVDLICDAVNEVLCSNCTGLIPYIFFIRYEHSDEINRMLTALCDVRVIWGGDRTIADLRKASLKPRANEITFADRYSICILNAESYLATEKKDVVANDFYNDTYLTDQNACTSPRLVVWLGKNIEKAQKIFWEYLNLSIKKKYTFQQKQSLDKLTAMCLLFEAEPCARIIKTEDNIITRIHLDGLNNRIMSYRESSGFFMEYAAKSLNEIYPVCGEKCQTLSYYGINVLDIHDFLNEYRPAGIDRVVPIGKTMDFSLFWDGYDLVESMSRVVDFFTE